MYTFTDITFTLKKLWHKTVLFLNCQNCEGGTSLKVHTTLDFTEPLRCGEKLCLLKYIE